MSEQESIASGTPDTAGSGWINLLKKSTIAASDRSAIQVGLIG